MHGGGHVWRGGACMAGGACVAGGVHGREACMLGKGACMALGGMCSRYYEIRSMSRWYASYWNAFLFTFVSFPYELFPVFHEHPRGLLGSPNELKFVTAHDKK